MKKYKDLFLHMTLIISHRQNAATLSSPNRKKMSMLMLNNEATGRFVVYFISVHKLTVSFHI